MGRLSYAGSAFSGGTGASGGTGTTGGTADTSDDVSESARSGTLSFQSRDGSLRQSAEVRKRGIWSSMNEHILVTMASSLGMLLYDNYALENIGDGGTVLQVFTAYMVVGIPASYMQMVLGQFTHMGVFLLKRMVPIADGAGFAYCITIFFVSMLSVLQVQTMFLYIVLSLVPGPLQWSKCGGPNCWEVYRECKEIVPCVNETVHIAAYVYWSETLMSGQSKVEDRHISLPSKEAVLTSLFLWVLIYMLSLVSLFKLKKIVRHMTVLHLLIKGWTAFMLLWTAGIVDAFTNMTMQSIINLGNINAWREATVRVVVAMTLGDFSHVMMGALASDSAKIGTTSWLAGVLSFTSIFIDDVTVNSAAIALCKRVNLPLDKRYLLFHPPNSPMHLTLIPTTFELLPWPRLWNLLFFINKTLAILFRVIFNIHFLLEAVSHRFPALSSYKKYSAPMFCALAWAMGSVLQGHAAYEIRHNFIRVATYFAQYFNVLFFVVMTCYVYGVRRFCDDIHFLRKSPPNLYWKIVWVFLPITLMLTISTEYLDWRSEFYMERIVEIILMFSPYLALTTFEVIKKIIERKTITLITPEAKWGPKEPERRARRRQFNPKKATRSMMGALRCHHMCITNSRTLKALVTKEAEIMSRLGGPGAHTAAERTSSTSNIGLRGSIDS